MVFTCFSCTALANNGKAECLQELATLDKKFTLQELSKTEIDKACDNICGKQEERTFCFFMYQKYLKGLSVEDIGTDVEKCYLGLRSLQSESAYRMHLENVKDREENLKISGYREHLKTICSFYK